MSVHQVASTKGLPLDVVGTGDGAEIADRGINLRDGSVPTPFAVLRRSALQGNLARMARYCAEHAVSLAPHGKTTMSPELIAAQLEHGAWGITAATISQVRAFREMGVPRVLLANMLVDPAGLRWASEQLADPGFELIAYVDSLAGVELMREILESPAGARPLPVLLEVGAHGGRTGTRDLDSSLAIAEAVAAAPALMLNGVGAFEGIIGGDREPATIEGVDAFLRDVRSTAEELMARDLVAAPELIVSAGGSAYFDRVVEAFRPPWQTTLPVRVVLRSGCYVTHDVGAYDAVSPLGSHGDGGLAAALEVWGRVLSTPEPRLALVDIGKRDASFDGNLPLPLRVVRAGGEPSPADGMRVARLNDQHAYVELPADGLLAVGDLIAFGISHPCTTFDRWRVILVVDDDDAVVDLAHTWF